MRIFFSKPDKQLQQPNRSIKAATDSTESCCYGHSVSIVLALQETTIRSRGVHPYMSKVIPLPYVYSEWGAEITSKSRVTDCGLVKRVSWTAILNCLFPCVV